VRAADEGAGRGVSRRDRHRGVDGVRRQRQLRHHDQAAARRTRGAQRPGGGAARQGWVERERRSSGRPRRVLCELCARHGLERQAVRRSRREIRPGRGRIPPKRYPCGGVIHTGIDAALQIRDELGPKVADIVAIKAGIAKYAASRAGTEYPANMEAAKFNLQYVVAASLVHGAPKLATFEPDAIKDERVKALAKTVTVAIDPEFAAAHEDYPTRVAVMLKDGAALEKLVVYASGTAQNPMSAAQMRDKFFDCAAHAGVERAVPKRSQARSIGSASSHRSTSSGRCCGAASG
jgi:hypothetical protein